MGKTCIIAKFQWTDLVFCSHSGEGKTSSYSQTNTENCVSGSNLSMFAVVIFQFR